MDEVIDKLKDNLPVVIVIGGSVLIIILLIFLNQRRRKAKTAEESHVRRALAAMDREQQLATAVAQLPIGDSLEKVAGKISELYKEHFQLRVYRIYAGREQSETVQDILLKEAGAFSTNELSPAAALPVKLPASLIDGYTQPQIVKSSSLVGNKVTGEGENVTVIPWHGAFGWRGLVIAKGENSQALDFLNNFREPISALNDWLSVALEIADCRESSAANEQRLAHVTNFIQAVAKVKESASPAEIVPSTAMLLGADSSAMWLLDNGSQVLSMAASTGLHSSDFLPQPVGQGLAGSVLQTGQPLALRDAPTDPRCLFPNETRESGIGSYLGVPISIDAKPVGVLEVHTREPKAWSKSETDMLDAVAVAISDIMRQGTEQADKLKVQSAFMGLSESLQRLRSPEDLLEAVVEVLGHALAASRVFAIDLNPAERPVTVRHEYKTSDVKSAIGVQFTADMLQPMLNRAKSGTPVVSDNETNSLMGSDLATNLGVQSELFIPVRYDGETRVLLYVHQCDRKREWSADEIEFADRVGRQLGLSLANLAALDAASRSAEANQAGGTSSRSGALKAQEAELERRLADLRATEMQARSRIEKLNALEAEARGSDRVKNLEAALAQERERREGEAKNSQQTIQQLLSTNQLKSEFIVGAGREISSSVQSLAAIAQLLEGGSRGQLNGPQLKAVQDIAAWLQKINSSLNDLIEYGSARTR